jgi:hypothetical protein
LAGGGVGGEYVPPLAKSASGDRIFSQFRHFPFWRKHFMVPRDFAIGKVILLI